MLKSKTVPILRHVAKHESHVGSGESRIWAGFVSKVQTIDGLRQSGIKSMFGQTMIGVLKTIFAPRLRELACQVDPGRAQQVEHCGNMD